MVFGPSRYKACVAPGCIESDDDNEGWQVAGINATGRVEYWCSTCASSLTAKHLTLDRARVERLAALSRLPQEIIEQSTATGNPAQAVGRSAEQDDSDSDGYVSVRRLGKAPPAGKGKASVAHDSDSDDDLPPPRPVKSPPAHQAGKPAPKKSSAPTVEDSDDDDDLLPPRRQSIKPAPKAAPAGKAPPSQTPSKGKVVDMDDDSDDDDLPPLRASQRPAQPTRQASKNSSGTARESKAPVTAGKKAVVAVDSDSD